MEDLKMKEHLQEMEKKLDDLVKAGQQRVKRDGYKEKALKAKLGNIAHKLDKFKDQEIENDDAKKHVELVNRVQ